MAVTLENSDSNEIWLRYDDAPPRRLRIDRTQVLPTENLMRDDEETALEALRSGVSPPLAGGAVTLDGPFAVRRHPAPLVEAGAVELPLPAEVKSVTVWQEEGPALWGAVQYRASKRFALSEREYDELAHEIGSQGATEFFLAGLKEGGRGVNSIWLWNLSNHWLPLQRWIRARAKTYLAQVTPSRENPQALPKPEAVRLRLSAQAAEARGQWLPALEDWGRLVNGSVGPENLQARLSQARVLRRIGEAFMADIQLRGLLAFGDSSARAAAGAELACWYSADNDPDSELSLAAARLVLAPDAAGLDRLARVALAFGHTEEALMLWLTLPEELRPAEEVAQAAYRLQQF